MSISRNSRHKRRATGGRMPIHKKKRKFEMGRVPSMTKIGAKRIIYVRGRGGNIKTRALKNDHGNFSWGSEAISCKTRILDTVYNATNNELVRTKTLVKNTIVSVDSTPFRQWYLRKLPISSTLATCWLASLLAQDRADVSTDTSWKVKNLSSTRRKPQVKEDETCQTRMDPISTPADSPWIYWPGRLLVSCEITSEALRLGLVFPKRFNP